MCEELMLIQDLNILWRLFQKWAQEERELTMEFRVSNDMLTKFNE